MGYGALASQRFDAAETQFRQAAALYPGAPEPDAALIEVDQARMQKTLMDLQAQGGASGDGGAMGRRGRTL